MEIAQEDQLLMMGSIQNHVNILVKKRKRTKRQRAPAPSSPGIATTTSTSSSTDDVAGLNIISSYSDQHHEFSPESSSEEEEDMANCLILLAQGHNHTNIITSKQPIEVATPTFTSTTCKQAVGFDVYECKTCNRCFPSFQALGGHRASHKRPIKTPGFIQNQEQMKKITISTSTESGFLMMEQQESETQFINENTSIHPSLTLQMGITKNNNNNNKSRIHECSICGAEFSSGQALGGHMRRHRSSTSTTTTSTTTIMSSSPIESANTNKKSRNNGLSLDLNLPAPEEDHMNKFIYTSKLHQPALVAFSPPSLVDCHY